MNSRRRTFACRQTLIATGVPNVLEATKFPKWNVGLLQRASKSRRCADSLTLNCKSIWSWTVFQQPANRDG